MKRSFWRGAILAGITLAWSIEDVIAEPLDVKTGLWEVTVQSELHGKPPLSQADTENLPPQLRSAMEKVLAAGSKPHTNVIKQCVTQDMLDKSENVFNIAVPGMSCSDKVTSQTRTSLAGTLDCQGQGMRETGDFAYKATDREHVTGKINLANADGTNTLSAKGAVSGRWTSDACEVSK